MATVLNPTAFDLFCLPLRATIGSGDEVEVTDEQAELVTGSVFVVTLSKPAATPVRKAVVRGAKTVETTEAPAVETR